MRRGSIIKWNGPVEVVILADTGDDGLKFVAREKLDWFDLLHVGLTRARYRCVVVAN